jgi:3',5'-cyclic AMP phosphodiesterase CpdA
MRLLAVGGVTFASGLGGCQLRGSNASSPAVEDDFFFLQLTDTHWGYEGPANPGASHTLRDTVRIINDSAVRPRFVIFTGDLVQTTRDDAERDARMRQFRDIVSELRVPELYFIPGEHDAALDGGASYRAHFGAQSYSFDRGGVHFIALDNASDPNGALGAPQLAWLQRDLQATPRETRIVVFAHRPLFPLFPNWTWNTADGERALSMFADHPHVTVFYGHIHQEHHFQTAHVVHHAARSLVFPLPQAGSTPSRAPLPWHDDALDHGLGYRSVHIVRPNIALEEVPIANPPALARNALGSTAY